MPEATVTPQQSPELPLPLLCPLPTMPDPFPHTRTSARDSTGCIRMTVEEIAFHAETLPRIRRLNVTVEGRDGDVRILDECKLELTRGDARMVIPVPGRVRIDQPFAFEAESCTARLQLDSSATRGESTPWSASSMGPTTSISCKECDTTLLACNTIQQWKDLPSEGWEEMMDFWHCHRPHAGTSSHYSSLKSGRFQAKPGICLISMTQFIFSSKDISFDTVSTTISDRKEDVEEHKHTPRHRYKRPTMTLKRGTFLLYSMSEVLLPAISRKATLTKGSSFTRSLQEMQCAYGHVYGWKCTN